MNSKTIVMLYNPHLHLYTGDQRRFEKLETKIEEIEKKNVRMCTTVALTCSMS